MHLERSFLIGEVEATRQFFRNATRTLSEADSGYAPTEGAMTVAQQVAHVAHTVEWFMDGAKSPSGFDTNFEEHMRIVCAVTSLEEARAWFERAVDSFAAWIQEASDEELASALPDGPIMGGMPRFGLVMALIDHTAHHRGTLAAYLRALGRTPPMPYMPDEASA